MSEYEALVRKRAERLGATVVEERGGLRVLDASGGESWHRLGGRAEEMHDARVASGIPSDAIGRHAAVLGEKNMGRWVEGAR